MILAAKATVAATAGEEGLPYQWVAAGSGGTIYTSTDADASTWTLRTSSFGTTIVRNVCSNGIDTYVAVGEDGKIASSPDGQNWTQETSPFGTDNIQGICYGDGYFVAVSNETNSKIATSPDGQNWTLETNPTTDQQVAVAYGDGKFVSISGTSAGDDLYATDPTGTWTIQSGPINPGAQNALFYVPHLPMWLQGFASDATSPYYVARYSVTGSASWTNISWPYGTSFVFASGGFTTNGSVIVAGGLKTSSPSQYDVASSTDGINWTDRTPVSPSYVIAGLEVDDAGFMIAYGNRIQSTTDGITWTDRGATPVTFSGVCHSSGKPSIR